MQRLSLNEGNSTQINSFRIVKVRRGGSTATSDKPVNLFCILFTFLQTPAFNFGIQTTTSSLILEFHQIQPKQKAQMTNLKPQKPSLKKKLRQKKKRKSQKKVAPFFPLLHLSSRLEIRLLRKEHQFLVLNSNSEAMHRLKANLV
jgi:hypothetical protein